MTQGARVFACFHMLAAVVLLGELFATAQELYAQRVETFKRIAQLQRTLDERLLLSLLNRALMLRPKVQRDGQGLTELEFVVTMLLELGEVDEKVVRPMILQFRSLNLSGNGRLGLEDLRLNKAMDEETKRGRTRANASKLTFDNQNLSLRSEPSNVQPQAGQSRRSSPSAQTALSIDEAATPAPNMAPIEAPVVVSSPSVTDARDTAMASTASPSCGAQAHAAAQSAATSDAGTQLRDLWGFRRADQWSHLSA